MRPKHTGMYKIPAEFKKYSEQLAHQINDLWVLSRSVITVDDLNGSDSLTLTSGALNRSVKLLLRAMPDVFKFLHHSVKDGIKKNGLDHLNNQVNRDLFVWALNKSSSNVNTLTDVKSVDIAFSNIIAMYANDVSLKPAQYTYHIKFKRFSPLLARQISDMYLRTKQEDESPFTLHTVRLVRSLDALEQVLSASPPCLPESIQQKLFSKGFDCLSDNYVSSRLEYTGVKYSLDSIKLKTRFDDALANIKSMYFKRKCHQFSHINAQVAQIDVSRAMILDYEIFVDVRNLFEGVAKKYIELDTKSDDTLIGNINGSLNHLLALLQGELKDKCRDVSVKECIRSNTDIVNLYVNSCKSRPHDFNGFLKVVAPDIYGEFRVVHLRDGDDFLSFISKVSRKLGEEYKRYLDNTDKAKWSRLSYKRSFGKYIFLHRDSEQLKAMEHAMCERGIAGLADNDGAGFKLLNEHILVNAKDPKATDVRRPLNVALDIYNYVTQSSKRLNHFLPHVLAFYNENDGTESIVDLQFIYTNYPKLFDDMNKYVEHKKISTDGTAILQITLRTQINAIKMLFKRYNDGLSDSDRAQIKEQGFVAFGNNKYQILKSFRQWVQSDVKNNNLETTYAVSLQTHLNVVCNFFDIPSSNAYRVSYNKTKKLQARKSKKNLYTFEQVVKIAYSIEKALLEDGLTELQTLCLHAARIFVKTGWNLTPTLELDHDDLVYFDTPLTGNKTAAVRLFKRRADYQTHFPEFGENVIEKVDAEAVMDEYETGRVTQAVMSNLEAIKNITDGVASKHKQENLRKRLFAYRDGHFVRVLSQNTFTSCINRLLKSQGVHDNFSVTKIRKSGMNYTYRKVAKNFEKYKKAGMHTPQAFYQFYLKMEDGEVEETLVQAIQVMGDYLIRDKSDKVIFVTGELNETKNTPTGKCAQTADSNSVKKFKKNNRKFFSDHEIDSCADFGACLFCEHFRCIADAEGVWRLLSFEEVVIRRKQSSSYYIGSNDGSDQQVSIQKSKKRVIEILADLAELNKDAIMEGRELFNSHGVHPDWEIV